MSSSLQKCSIALSEQHLLFCLQHGLFIPGFVDEQGLYFSACQPSFTQQIKVILTQPEWAIYRLGCFIRTVVVVQVFIMAMQVGGAEWGGHVSHSFSHCPPSDCLCPP